RRLELAGSGSGDARLAAAGADLCARVAVADAPAPGRDEAPGRAQLDDPVVAGIGDVDVAVGIVDRDVAGPVELAGARSRGADGFGEGVAAEGGEGNVGAVGRSGGVGGHDPVVVDRVDREVAGFEVQGPGAAVRTVVRGRGGGNRPVFTG